MKKLSVKRTKTKKNTLNDNKRNNPNCISYHDNCPSNPCRSNNSNANRRKWNTYTSTKCK